MSLRPLRKSSSMFSIWVPALRRCELHQAVKVWGWGGGRGQGSGPISELQVLGSSSRSPMDLLCTLNQLPSPPSFSIPYPTTPKRPAADRKCWPWEGLHMLPAATASVESG